MSSERGSVRLARPTDLPALAALSRTARHSLGLPLEPEALSLYRLFRVPLGLLRASDLIWVSTDSRTIDGLVRIDADAHGDWSIVELDAIGSRDQREVRMSMIDRVVREAGRRGVPRIHVACADVHENTELLAASGFRAYADETIFLRHAAPAPARPTGMQMRPLHASDAHDLARAYAQTTPANVLHVEDFSLRDWGQAATGWAPRASISPALRLGESAAFALSTEPGALSGWLLAGVASESGERHPHALRIFLRPDVDPTLAIALGLNEIGDRATARGTDRNPVLAVVRGYEAGLKAPLAAAGFLPVGHVRLYLRESRVRLTAPALFPATG